MTATTRRFDPTALPRTLFLSLELGEGGWKLSYTSGFGEPVLRRQVASRDAQALLRAIASMKERLDLPATCRVVSCYEAGRDGFWLHRFLVANGVENLVVDSSSIEVSRRRLRISWSSPGIRRRLVWARSEGCGCWRRSRKTRRSSLRTRAAAQQDEMRRPAS